MVGDDLPPSVTPPAPPNPSAPQVKASRAPPSPPTPPARGGGTHGRGANRHESCIVRDVDGTTCTPATWPAPDHDVARD